MGATKVFSVRSWQKLPLCPTEAMPASSKIDLDWPGPSSSATMVTPGITDIRGGKNYCATEARREE